MTFANAIAKELLLAFKSTCPSSVPNRQRQALFVGWLKSQLAALRLVRGPRAASAAHLYEMFKGLTEAEIIREVAQLCQQG